MFIDKFHINDALVRNSVLAGMYLSTAAYASIIVGSNLPSGLSKLLTGVIFSCGLVMIILTHCDLFTGKMLLLQHLLEDRKIKLKSTKEITMELVEEWVYSYVFNFVGCLLVCLLVGVVVPDKITVIVTNKLSHSLPQLFCLGFLCNMLVCTAVYLGNKTKSVIQIMIPIIIFIVCGFEHSIADMFYFIQATLNGSFPISVLIKPLLVITLGNIFGGLFVSRIIQRVV